MKKLKLLFVPLIALTLMSCGKKDNDEEEYHVDETIVPDTSVSGSLSLRFFERGFGDTWLQNVVKTFKAKYPNVNVRVSSSHEAKTVYGEIIGDKETQYDLYMMEANIMDYTDLFVNLNDVYNGTVIDESITVKDKLEESYYQSCSDENGDFYTLPAYCGAYGFNYNREYISESEIPVTTDELISLCGSLKDQSITPLVFSGGDDSVYLNFLYSSLAAQYEGKEAYLKAQVGRVWDQTSQTYKTNVSSAYLPGHVKASQVLESLYWLPNGNISNQCVGYNANNAQIKLLDDSNHTAMMFNGSWMMTEMASIIKDFEIDVNNFGMFKTPIISAIREKCSTIENDAELSALVKAIDKGENSLSGSGYSVDQADFDRVKEARKFVYVGSEGSRFVITRKGQHPELAKLFLRFYYSNFAIQAVNASKAGCYVPVKSSTIDTSSMNNFLKDVYKILSGSEKFFNLPAAFMAVTPYLYPEGLTYEKALGSPNGTDRKNTQQMLQVKQAAWTANDNAKFKLEMARHGYSLDE